MGSASQPMLVVKANRALLKKKRSFKELRASYVGQMGQEKLEFKTLSPEELKKIRIKIRAQAKKDQRHVVQMRILAFFILIMAFVGLYLFIS